MNEVPYYILNRDDLRRLLRPVKTEANWQRLFDIRVSTAGLLGAALIYATALIPSLIRYQRAGSTTQPALPAVIDPAIFTDNAEVIADVPVANASDQTAAADNILAYDALSINAPVTWEVTYTNESIQASLQNGLAHLKGTARPGEQGTVMLTGHSSNFAWAKGEYKTVFAPLLKAQLNDQLTLVYQGVTYHYAVTQIYEAEPTKISLLQPDTATQLRLITCTPLGSTRKRLIVDAVQTDPDPATNQPFTGTPLTNSEIIATR